MSPRTKQWVREGGRVSKHVIAAQRATRAQIRAAQGEYELLEPPDDVVEAEGVVGMRPEAIQEVRIPAPDLQASDQSQSDSSSGPVDNPSDSSRGSGGNKSDDDDDDPSGISVGDKVAMAQVFIEFIGRAAISREIDHLWTHPSPSRYRDREWGGLSEIFCTPFR